MDRNKDTDNRSNDTDLPGYPHYAPEEDILNPQNGFHKVSTDAEELPNSQSIARKMASERDRLNGDNSLRATEDSDDLGIVSGTEADVTREDLEMLGRRDDDSDMGEDELVGSSRVDNIDNEDDLDIPGSELDDTSESIGEEDEENNYYSLGGDRNDALEEDQA